MTLFELREKFRQGKPSFGSWLQIANLPIADLLQRPGFDWCVTDLEHGTLEENNFYEIAHIIEKHNKLPLVRLADRNPAKISRLIENGAKGLILSAIENSEFLEELASSTRFPPAGIKGVGYCKENQYGRSMKHYIESGELPLIIAMIETAKGVESIDQILSCSAVDGLMIGPYDLSSSLGCPGEFSNKLFTHSVKKILEKTIEYKKFCGIHVLQDFAKEISLKIKQGYQFLPVSTDANLIVEGIDNLEGATGIKT